MSNKYNDELMVRAAIQYGLNKDIDIDETDLYRHLKLNVTAKNSQTIADKKALSIDIIKFILEASIWEICVSNNINQDIELDIEPLLIDESSGTWRVRAGSKLMSILINPSDGMIRYQIDPVNCGHRCQKHTQCLNVAPLMQVVIKDALTALKPIIEDLLSIRRTSVPNTETSELSDVISIMNNALKGPISIDSLLDIMRLTRDKLTLIDERSFKQKLTKAMLGTDLKE